jgi:hypothetical protein
LFLISEQGVLVDDGKRRSSIYVVRSRNGGTTFDEPVKIVVNGVINKAEMPVVLPGGTLFVSFVDVALNLDPATGMPAQSDRRRAWVVRSTDGGHTFSTPLFVGEPSSGLPVVVFRCGRFQRTFSKPAVLCVPPEGRRAHRAELLDRRRRELNERCSRARSRCRCIEDHTVDGRE